MRRSHNITHLVVHQLASSDCLCLCGGLQTYENRVLSTLTGLNFAPSVPFITDTASVSEQLILAKAGCLHLPKCADLNECIALDWVQLLSFGQISLNKHGVLPTQQIWKTRPLKPALTCKGRNQRIKFRGSSKRHYYSEYTNTALTQILGRKILITSKQLFNNKQILLQQLWRGSNSQIVGISYAYTGG